MSPIFFLHLMAGSRQLLSVGANGIVPLLPFF